MAFILKPQSVLLFFLFLPQLSFAQLTTKQVINRFKNEFSEKCSAAFLKSPVPNQFVITFKRSFDLPSDPETVNQLYIFECTEDAYNKGQVFYLVNDFDQIELVHFAVPHFQDNTINNLNSNLPAEQDIQLLGFKTQTVLMNTDFDLSSLKLTSFSKWRGLGDASSEGAWNFEDGTFVLKEYFIDATYDEQINPEQIYKSN